MDPTESGHGTRRAIFAAFVANLGIAIAKFAAFLITGSASMMAESIHSVADTGNQGLLFLGGARARKPADQEHQFGYGAERYFWAFVVALVLFSLGALFSLYEGVEKLRHPHELESPAVAFVVLGIAVVLESFSLRTAVRESQPHRGGLSWWQFIRRTKTPGAARRAARGRRRALRPRCSRASASGSPSRLARPASTRSAAWRSACCSARSRSCSRSR